MGTAKTSRRLTRPQVEEVERRIQQGGYTIAGIARDLSVSETTVRYHRDRLNDMKDVDKTIPVILLKALHMDAVNDMIIKNLEKTSRRAGLLDDEGDPKALIQHDIKLKALNSTTTTMLAARQSLGIFPTKSGTPVFMNPAAADRLAKSLTAEQRTILLDEGERIVTT